MTDRKVAGKGRSNSLTNKRTLKIKPTLSTGSPHELSPELFPSGVDVVEDTNEMSHFLTCSQSTRNRPTIGNNCTGSRCSSALCPSARFNEDSNNVAVAVLNRVSDTMLTLFEKLSKRIDTNAVDVAKLVVEDRDRIRELERRVQAIEEEQKIMMMKQQDADTEPKAPAARGNTPSVAPKAPGAIRKTPAAKKQEISAGKQKTPAAKQIIPSAKHVTPAAKRKAPAAKQRLPAAKKIIPAEKPNENPAVPPLDPVEGTPQSQPPVVARAAGARTPRPCCHCGKVLSIPYVYLHQKKCTQKGPL